MDYKYFNEILFITIVVLMVLNYFRGSEMNKGTANSIIERTFETFTHNFEFVGLNHQSTTGMTRDHLGTYLACVEEESCSSFRLFLTGRKNVSFGILNVQLMKRQDFIYTNLVSLAFPEKDQIVFETAVEVQDTPKGILYMLKSKNFKKSAEDFADLRTIGLKIAMENVTRKSLLIFAETSETVECFFDKSFCDLINSHGDLIEMIQVTDCMGSGFHKGVNAKIVLNVGRKTQEDFEGISLLIGEFLIAVDRYHDFDPKSRVKEVLGENRKKLAVLRDKQKRSENGETQLSYEEKYAKMTPAEKKKAEEKEAKRAKNKGKMVKMVKG